MASDLVIPVEEFQLIYQVIHSILNNEESDLPTACWYFNIIAAELLKRKYNLDAKAEGGFAVIQLDESSSKLALGDMDAQGSLISTVDKFHFWIRTSDWYFDFMSPMYGEMYKRGGGIIEVSPKMFQRKVSDMCSSPEEIIKPGDFYFEPNNQVTEFYIKRFNSFVVNSDFVRLASDWYKRPPEETRRQMNIGNQKGEVAKVKLSRILLRGKW